MAGGHGGARQGAGGKPQKLKTGRKKDPLAFLLAVMNDEEAPAALRVRSAVAAAQYVHTKTGEGGKKEARQAAADRAQSGKFQPAQPPKLVVNNG